MNSSSGGVDRLVVHGTSDDIPNGTSPRFPVRLDYFDCYYLTHRLVSFVPHHGQYCYFPPLSLSIQFGRKCSENPNSDKASYNEEDKENKCTRSKARKRKHLTTKDKQMLQEYCFHSRQLGGNRDEDHEHDKGDKTAQGLYENAKHVNFGIDTFEICKAVGLILMWYICAFVLILSLPLSLF